MSETLFDLKESNLYLLARSTTLFSEMVPDLPTQISVETQIDTDFPREESDEDHTRVLINYTNRKGNPILYKVLNQNRLTSTVDIDDFIIKYGFFIGEETLPEDPVDQMKTLIMAALTFSCGAVLGFDEEESNTGAKTLANWFISAATSVLYDDPLDCIINVQEVQSKDTDNYIPMITAMWCVKQRK